MLLAGTSRDVMEVHVFERTAVSRRVLSWVLLACVFLGVALLPGCAPAPQKRMPTQSQPIVFAVIGDFGAAGEGEAGVAKLVKSWNPAYIVTTGDNYYLHDAGGEGTARYDDSVGQFYGPWLKDISTTGTHLPQGAAKVNAFFPCPGNHDYHEALPAPQTYLDYFTLPGKGFKNTSKNELYYDFTEGPVHFFMLDSNPEEPDGATADSKQAQWLQARLPRSKSKWNLVFLHHAPYASDTTEGSTERSRWPFAQWGASAVLSGHAHIYERVMRDNIVYFVNGLGGAEKYQLADKPVADSVERYNADWGAQKVTVTASTMTFEFYNTKGTLVDRYAVPAK